MEEMDPTLGCSNYMYPKKCLFKSHNEKEDGKVYHGNNKACKIQVEGAT